MLIDKQPRFWNKNGRFFQLLVTSRSVDGGEMTWAMKHPLDETRVVDVDFPWKNTLPFQVSVDVWKGGTEGFSATATTELLNGDVYRRTRTATAIIQEPTFDTSGDDPVQLTDRTCTGFTEEDTNWYKVIPEDEL